MENFDDLLDVEFPREKDELFTHQCPDWTNNAILNYGFNNFNFYADGYREAANILVKECVAERAVNDIYVYPIVFLYRQYLELRLKEVIIGLNYCVNGKEKFPQHHRIDSLWDEFMKLYKEIGEDITHQDIKNTQRLIREFASLDSDSFAFRYPENKLGKDTIKRGTIINLRNFGEVMNRIARLLDAVSDQIAHYRNLADDIRQG
jgi:hypothetical protein